MIRTQYHTPAGEIIFNLTDEQLTDALESGSGCLWIDIAYCEEQKGKIADWLREHFTFHPLAIDDALEEAHVSRADDWHQYMYIVMHALALEINRTVETLELDSFLGPNYLVTLHSQPIEALDQFWTHCQRGATSYHTVGSARLFYALSDRVVADYLTVVDGLEEEIDELESEIFAQPRRETVNRIFRLRRTLLKLRRLLGTMRETANRLARDSFSQIKESERIYHRDVYDHLVRLYDIVDGMRDMMTGALDSFVSVSSTRLNEVMRTLTIVTVLFMPLTFFTGFFGMNFFADPYALKENPLPAEVMFWVCMAIMALTPPVMLLWMRRRGWLRPTLHAEGEEKEEQRSE
jgi:magnesium transporter